MKPLCDCFQNSTCEFFSKFSTDKEENSHINGILNVHQIEELEKLDENDRRKRLIELVRKIDLDEDDDLDEDEVRVLILK